MGAPFVATACDDRERSEGRARADECRRRAGDGEGEDGAFSTTQGAILGQLALLLAFTDSLAAGRHDLRKQVVVDEANAIGAAFLRAELVPSRHRQEIEDLLRSGDVHRSQRAVLSRITAERTPTPVDALLVAAVNDVIDLHTKRVAALLDHVPEIVVILLGFVATIALARTGFAAGIADGAAGC